MITIKYKNYDINFSSISFRDIREAMMDYEKLRDSLGGSSDILCVRTIISLADDVSNTLKHIHKSKAEPSKSDREKVKYLRRLVLALISNPEYNSGLSLSVKELAINLEDFLVRNKLLDEDKDSIGISIAYKSDCIDFTYSMKDIDIVKEYVDDDFHFMKCTSIKCFGEVLHSSSNVSDHELYIYLLFIIVSAMRQGLNVSEGALIDLDCLDEKQYSTDSSSCVECKSAYGELVLDLLKQKEKF